MLDVLEGDGHFAEVLVASGGFTGGEALFVAKRDDVIRQPGEHRVDGLFVWGHPVDRLGEELAAGLKDVAEEFGGPAAGFGIDLRGPVAGGEEYCSAVGLDGAVFLEG